MLPRSVRSSLWPLPKSTVTRGTGRALSQTHSNESDRKEATRGCEKSTLLAMRALVQQNSSSRRPRSWKSSTGFPELQAAAQAESKSECQRTSPGATVREGRSSDASPVRRAFSIGLSTVLLLRSRGGSWSAELARASTGRARTSEARLVMSGFLGAVSPRTPNSLGYPPRAGRLQQLREPASVRAAAE